MVESTARVYRSELRARQARETRARIIAAAGELFAQQGYQATTIAAIARVAGVSGETVKSAASKAELLIAAFEMTFSGREGAESLTDTEVAGGVLDLPDDAFLDTVLTQITEANSRGHRLWTVLLGAALSDERVDEVLAQILRRRADDYRRLVDELMARGLAVAQDDPRRTAATLSFLLSPESYQQLVAQSGWERDTYMQWLRAAVVAELAR
ncbi:TetR/AcrR family transcriptional regulator [Microbacterium sp. NPDC089987]|uniref:TetR/AcrR family transcriptional regulator n=1 Tax=Microbacterium sp. NPDC089987 TaxID=3364202 RepID=UPI00381D47CE